MEKQLSLTEMLRIAEKVDRWEWTERPQILGTDWEGELEYPKADYTFIGTLKESPFVVLVLKNHYECPYAGAHTDFALKIQAHGFALGGAWINKGRWYFGVTEPEGEERIKSIFEVAKMNYISSETRKKEEVLKLGRKI